MDSRRGHKLNRLQLLPETPHQRHPRLACTGGHLDQYPAPHARHFAGQRLDAFDLRQDITPFLTPSSTSSAASTRKLRRHPSGRSFDCPDKHSQTRGGPLLRRIRSWDTLLDPTAVRTCAVGVLRRRREGVLVVYGPLITSSDSLPHVTGNPTTTRRRPTGPRSGTPRRLAPPSRVAGVR